MDIYNFILDNGVLCIFGFVGFLVFYKGIPFLIKYNEDRHRKTETKLSNIDCNLRNHIVESKSEKLTLKKDISTIENDVMGIKKSIKKIQEDQHEQKGTMATIESFIVGNNKRKKNDRDYF